MTTNTLKYQDKDQAEDAEYDTKQDGGSLWHRKTNGRATLVYALQWHIQSWSQGGFPNVANVTGW